MLLSAFIMLAASCRDNTKPEPTPEPEPVEPKPKVPRQYSTWYFDTIEIRTNKVEYTTKTNPRNRLTSYGNEYRFDIAFGYSAKYDSLVLHGDSLIDYGINFYVYHKTTAYSVLEEGKHILKYEKVDGKDRFTLEPTWFTKYYPYQNGKDSVLIWGEFNEP